MGREDGLAVSWGHGFKRSGEEEEGGRWKGHTDRQTMGKEKEDEEEEEEEAVTWEEENLDNCE